MHLRRKARARHFIAVYQDALGTYTSAKHTVIELNAALSFYSTSRASADDPSLLRTAYSPTSPSPCGSNGTKLSPRYASGQALARLFSSSAADTYQLERNDDDVGQATPSIREARHRPSCLGNVARPPTAC